MIATRSFIRVILSLLFVYTSFADDHTHQYTSNEEVTLWMNKVGPYHNPQETYAYYSLPLCRPAGKSIRHKSDSIGVLLEGNDLTDSGLDVKFRENKEDKHICQLKIGDDEEEILTDAVREHYWYQMYIDELPIWGMLGEYMVADDDQGGELRQGFIYTRKDFSISYNGNQIIEVNLTSENPQPIKSGASYKMTFSVTWRATDKSFADRFDRYLDFDFFEHQIHWFSIFNSFMMVIFLCGVVALILMRTLRNDYIKYSNEEEELELESVMDETGWKMVHSEVFRRPQHLMLYAALIGTGYQLFVLALLVITVTLMFSFYDDRGSVGSTLIACYALTTFVAGYTSGSFYKRNEGRDWKICMILTVVLFPGFCGTIIVLLNFIAIAYESNTAIGAYTLFTMTLIWLLASCPLMVLGTIVGRANAVAGDFPCRVSQVERPIPDGKWFTRPLALAAIAGVLPFGSIFIEMYFIFTSFWNYKFYYVYGFMFLVYCILITVTICVTIVATYFLLNAEDWRWHWTSLASGGASAVYLYLYAFYYFFTKTRMSGFLQTAYYFGYMGIFCVGLFILCGTIGYMGSNIFVRRIYQYIKSD